MKLQIIIIAANGKNKIKMYVVGDKVQTGYGMVKFLKRRIDELIDKNGDDVNEQIKKQYVLSN